MDRMSALDASFLAIEDDTNPMHIGSVATFEGPPPTYGDMVRMIAGKLRHVPRYRQKVRTLPFQLGRPVWVDDPHFQILYHIRHTAVPSPGSEDQLRNLAGRVLAQRLDRSKPLWEIWIVEGLRDGRWALISKVHHSIVDGVAGTDLMAVMFDTTPEFQEPSVDSWRAEPEPNVVELLADAAMDSFVRPVDRLRSLPGLVRAPLPPGMSLHDIQRSLSVTIDTFRRRTAELNGPIGPHRRWSWARTSLADVKEIRNALPGTVNDVVLAVITRGFRDLLLGRGAAVEGRVVRTLVPVSVRSADEKGTFNNRVSGMFPDLPVGIANPVERLDNLRLQMDGLKESKMAVGGDRLIQMSGFAPPMLLNMGQRLASRLPQNMVNTVTTNVPGPQIPLYVMGRQMVEAYPFVPIMGRVRISIAIFSYLGALTFGVTGDYDTAPDIDVLCRGIINGMDELLEVARALRPVAAVAPAGNGKRRARPRKARAPRRPASRAGRRVSPRA